MSALGPSVPPSVTSIVLNYGTPQDSLRAVDSLIRQTYPGLNKVVLVDNNSPDDSKQVLQESSPSDAELILSSENLGFGGGLNLVLKELDTDYAFILNSDAWCDGNTVIERMVQRATATERVGAVAPKTVFDERWIRIVIDSDSRLPVLAGDRDGRLLGVALVGVDVGGEPLTFDDIFFEAGFHDEEKTWDRRFRWTLGKASVLVPVRAQVERGTITLYLMTDSTTGVRLSTSHHRESREVRATASNLAFTHRPHRISIEFGPEDEVLRINNAGSHLKGSFHGADRGFGSFDLGEFAEPDPVFAFCGAAALLSRQALRDVGVFEESYFLYYEDTELSWRMQKAGYEVWYEPTALVRHGLSASTGGEGEDLFRFHVWRNRLMMVTVHGPALQAFRSVVGAFISLMRQAIRPHKASARRNLKLRARVLGSYMAALPRLLRQRA